MTLFTVILQYPDSDETYTGHVAATDYLGAIDTARRECLESNENLEWNDMGVLFVCYGHQEDLR